MFKIRKYKIKGKSKWNKSEGKNNVGSNAVFTNVYSAQWVSMECSMIWDSCEVRVSSLFSSTFNAGCFLCSVGEIMSF